MYKQLSEVNEENDNLRKCVLLCDVRVTTGQTLLLSARVTNKLKGTGKCLYTEVFIIYITEAVYIPYTLYCVLEEVYTPYNTANNVYCRARVMQYKCEYLAIYFVYMQRDVEQAHVCAILFNTSAVSTFLIFEFR